jgi:endonuclease/exonuclease/phosphatase family metal-dependent hydrolase
VWIGGGPHDFLLLAVWAMEDKKSSVRSYIGQLHEALAKHPEWLAANELKIIAGDFNSNKIWDEGAGTGDHSAFVALLEKHSVVSAYHGFFSEHQGEESRPTHYHSRWKQRGYHVDYVFIPEHWGAQVKNVEVGEPAFWLKFSDHMPLTVDVIESRLPTMEFTRAAINRK